MAAEVKLEDLGQGDFSPLINTDFTEVDSGHAPATLELIEVAPMGEPGSACGRAPFSLLFRGPAAQAPEQRTWRLRHPRLGELTLFLVPIGPDGTGMRYEAVFT